jgi:dolichol-phosphate mannosyltransferase
LDPSAEPIQPQSPTPRGNSDSSGLRESIRFRPAKVIVALPAYNEEASLPELLERLGEAFADSNLSYEIVIVNDGSKDATESIIQQFALQMPVHLVNHTVNQGLGITIRDGLREAMERADERDIIVTMDADNTHPPGLIPRMVQMIHEGCDIVIASRFEHGGTVKGVPFNRHLLSLGARVLFTIMFPTQGVRDYTSGFRAYRVSVIRQAFETYGDNFVGETGFSCMADILLKLRKLGCVFGEAPLRLRYDLKGGESKMQVFKTIRLTLSLLFRQRFSAKNK